MKIDYPISVYSIIYCYSKIIYDNTHILANYTHYIYTISSKLIAQSLKICKLNKN